MARDTSGAQITSKLLSTGTSATRHTLKLSLPLTSTCLGRPPVWCHPHNRQQQVPLRLPGLTPSQTLHPTMPPRRSMAHKVLRRLKSRKPGRGHLLRVLTLEQMTPMRHQFRLPTRARPRAIGLNGENGETRLHKTLLQLQARLLPPPQLYVLHKLHFQLLLRMPRCSTSTSTGHRHGELKIPSSSLDTAPTAKLEDRD
ncbi:hypothetical protein C8Q76DRAFT_726512 [Earliella scabrosa]|nr:hypothetical protein C8Q76DRAFT_726512 [Earliella scabrosa]